MSTETVIHVAPIAIAVLLGTYFLLKDLFGPTGSGRKCNGCGKSFTTSSEDTGVSIPAGQSVWNDIRRHYCVKCAPAAMRRHYEQPPQ